MMKPPAAVELIFSMWSLPTSRGSIVSRRKEEKMKRIIDVKVSVRKSELDKFRTDMLCVGVFSDEKKLDKTNKALDKRIGGLIEKIIRLGDFKGEEQTMEVIYIGRKIGAQRLMLTGLGEKKKATLDTLRKAAACAANTAVTRKVKSLALAVHKAFEGKIEAEAMGQACAEGAYFGSFRYDEYVTGSEDGRSEKLIVEIVEPADAESKRLNKGCTVGCCLGRAQSFARTLSSRPGNVINPPNLAAEAKKLAKETKRLGCTVLDERAMRQKKMGGILAVGAGSKSGPRFIILRYNGARKSNRLPAVALVGKAITFDSGGISIKPAANMETMKLDKSGGIAVMAALKAAAEMRLPINIWGLIPAAENLPSGSSYRPGDIITTYSGKTVEVQNTDAEGRMILCDALHYAGQQKCDIIIDIATLTGACVVALGQYMAGLFGNDDGLIKKVQAAAEESGEKVWYMPSSDEYAKEMKSKIADLKNIGSKWGGACTAAAFLGQFIDKAKWVHLDIAGMDMFEHNTAYSAEGSTGYGVRLLTTFLINLAKGKRA
jgi:leucyl aminopeptidase